VKNLKEIAEDPEERKKWWLRKFYHLPPTDPRYLAMTPEQIELEWQHFVLDNPKVAGNEHYTDPGYDDWERRAQEEDSRLTIKNTDSTPSDWVEVPLE
jgi:hypothetical protein